MKDYSKYFQNIESKNIDSSYGFITKLEVVGDEVHIWTPQTKKGEPRKYSINELPYFLEKLENQYQTIIENVETIKRNCLKPKKSLIITLAIAVIVPLILLGVSMMLSEAIIKGVILMLGSFLGGTFLGYLTYCILEEKFEKELETYKEFIEKRTDIEKQSKKDKNITENLSRSTTKAIEYKETLKSNRTTNEVYDINFMDKTSLKELRKLISNYNQSKSLFEDQIFIDPKAEKEQSKTRSLKK